MSLSESKLLESRTEEYRDYPKELKASIIAAIEANGGNVLATSKLFNIPRDTVNYWWRHSDRFVELKQPSGQNLADKLENIANSTADSLADHDLSIVSARDKAAIITGMATTMQLLRGLPTAITADLERTELTVILQSSLSAGLELGNDDVIDITPVTDLEQPYVKPAK